MAHAGKAASGQNRQMTGQFELEQRALQRRVWHVGPGGKNFKRRRGVAERGEQFLRIRRQLWFGLTGYKSRLWLRLRLRLRPRLVFVFTLVLTLTGDRSRHRLRAGRHATPQRSFSALSRRRCREA